MRMESTDHFGGEVRLHLVDGTVLSAKVDRPLGRGPEAPLPPGRLEAKFADCAGRVLAPDRVERLHDLLGRIDELRRVTDATDAMAPNGAAQ
jgi:hypothetical protein